MNKCASVIGNFDGHDDAPVRCRAHCPTKHVQGYPRCHWKPPSGDYSPHIAPVDLSCFLPGNYRAITGILPGTSNLGQSYSKVH